MDQLKQLTEDGFCIFPNVLDDAFLNRLRDLCYKLLDELPEDRKEQSGGQGSILGVSYRDQEFRDLICHKTALDCLASLGFDDPKFWSGYVIAREPGADRAYWHQDWPFWQEKEGQEELPHQLFLMYYLVDTTPENGCLRVIPGSHHKRCSAHDSEGHDSGARHADPAESPAYATHPDEIDVPMKAGELLVGDARILHAPYGNQSDKRRTVITMWYFPRHALLSDTMKAALQNNLFYPMLENLPESEKERLWKVLINYKGDAEPAKWDRNPQAFFKA
ncbi:MAG: phytanoyl-CoA dioxygenase family protein [Lentisphaeria bacterium]|nr:phytanoyl-CoA dioxygenase family protein [Lentisphaeria bacterium]NQZ69486.1 phytanoyl-CoA dioxygenase family protein [Lentisphaeria bacterium]